MEKRPLLFSYGTLKDPEIQKALFGHQLEMRQAFLKDWRLYSAADGYFFIKQENGFSVEGCILYVTQEQLRIADWWEEVPDYERMRITAHAEDRGACAAQVYTRPDGMGRPVKHSGISDHVLEQVISEAKKLKKRILDEET